MAMVSVQVTVHAAGEHGSAILALGVLQVPLPAAAVPSIRDYSEAELLDELRRRSDLRNADEAPF